MEMLAVTLKTFQIQCMKSFLLTAHYLIKIKSSIASSKNFEIIQLLICTIRYDPYELHSTIYSKPNSLKNFILPSLYIWKWFISPSKNNDKQMSPTYSIQKKILILPFILLVSLFYTVFLIWNNSFEMEYSNDKGRFQLMLKTHFEIHVEPFVCNNYFENVQFFNSNWFHLSWFWFNMGLIGHRMSSKSATTG